ncbi:MAG: Transcription termination/antitermination protein NusA [Holosporales bacterium]
MVSIRVKTSQQIQPKSEYLQVADVVAREKGIDRQIILSAMEAAIARAARAKYGTEYEIVAHIDTHTGDLELIKQSIVVEVVEDSFKEVSLEEARRRHKNFNVGDTLEEILPHIEFGRVAAQTARGIINQKVREAERMQLHEIYKDKIGHIISGSVKSSEFGEVIVDLGQGEGILRRDDLIPRETLRPTERVRAVLVELKVDGAGPIAILSRTHPLMMARLFEQEVPEIYEGIIEIKSIARDAGSRAKMAVYTSDVSLDPVGSCVGVRGARVQAVTGELQGEKVDIVVWSEDVATYVVEALKPARASKVVIDEESRRVDVIVPQDQLSLAIGRRGQNVRLASILTGWGIDILTEEQDAQRRLEENATRVQEFMDALDVDDMLAQLLCAEGFETLEDIAEISLQDFTRIDGFDEDLATELQDRANTAIERRRESVEEQVRALNVDEALLDLVNSTEKLTIASMDVLLKNNILCLDDIAELSGEELLDLLGRHSMSLDEANAIIMRARAHWFE